MKHMKTASGRHAGSRKAPTHPIKAYWWMSGTKDLYYSFIKSINNNKGIVHLTDGGWMPLAHCFFSVEQALQNPDPEHQEQRVADVRATVKEVRQALSKAYDDLDNVL